MPRPQFENQTLISAVTSKVITYFQKQEVSPITSHEYERHTFFSPRKTVSKLINLRLTFGEISGMSKGVREIILDNYLAADQGTGVFFSSCSRYTGTFHFDQGTFRVNSDREPSDILYYPSDLGAINQNIRAVQFDDTTGLTVVFRHTSLINDVDVTREMIGFIEQEVISR